MILLARTKKKRVPLQPPKKEASAQAAGRWLGGPRLCTYEGRLSRSREEIGVNSAFSFGAVLGGTLRAEGAIKISHSVSNSSRPPSVGLLSSGGSAVQDARAERLLSSDGGRGFHVGSGWIMPRHAHSNQWAGRMDTPPWLP